MAENSAGGACILHDTAIIKAEMAKKEYFLQRYNDIQSEYSRIIKILLENWKGEGADSFKEDTDIIGKNILNLFEILKAMSDTLTDCVSLLEEKSKALSDYNANPSSKKG